MRENTSRIIDTNHSLTFERGDRIFDVHQNLPLILEVIGVNDERWFKNENYNDVGNFPVDGIDVFYSDKPEYVEDYNWVTMFANYNSFDDVVIIRYLRTFHGLPTIPPVLNIQSRIREGMTSRRRESMSRSIGPLAEDWIFHFGDYPSLNNVTLAVELLIELSSVYLFNGLLVSKFGNFRQSAEWNKNFAETIGIVGINGTLARFTPEYISYIRSIITNHIIEKVKKTGEGIEVCKKKVSEFRKLFDEMVDQLFQV